MRLSPWMPAVWMGVICAALAAALLAPGPRPAVLMAEASATSLEAPASPAGPLLQTAEGRAFASRMTPDDVARGVGALAALPASDPHHLDFTWRAAAAPDVARGAALRAKLGGLRDQRRAAQAAALESAAALAVAIGPARRAALEPAP
ncbi:MAG: hypothetical protein H6739_21950 [Alphaproteobacteria bacterium]|nr:hypothetical protein [Alphaproteobacteria bacterium]